MIRMLSFLALLAAPGTSEPPRGLPFVIDEVTDGHARVEAEGETAVIPGDLTRVNGIAGEMAELLSGQLRKAS